MAAPPPKGTSSPASAIAANSPVSLGAGGPRRTADIMARLGPHPHRLRVWEAAVMFFAGFAFPALALAQAGHPLMGVLVGVGAVTGGFAARVVWLRERTTRRLKQLGVPPDEAAHVASLIARWDEPLCTEDALNRVMGQRAQLAQRTDAVGRDEIS